MSSASSAAPAPRILESVLAALLLAAAFIAFFRPIWASTGDTIPGADDSLLNLYTLEQWYRWLFRAQGSWLGGGFFSPGGNTLGFTDAMFLLALPFSLLRAIGLDPFTAYQATLYGSALAGGFAFYYFLRRELGLPALPSAIGTVPAVFSNAMFVSIGHTQLFSYVFIPIAAILLVRFVRASWEGSRSALVHGFALAILLPLFFFTGYYLAWFLVFFSLILALLALFRRDARAFGRELLGSRIKKRQVALLVLVAAAMFVPFFVTYMPALRETGGRPYANVVHTLPQWFDLFNVTAHNFVWGGAFLKWFAHHSQRPMYAELMKGMPLVTLATFAASVVILAVASRRASKRSAAPAAEEQPAPWVIGLALVTACGVLLAWILMLQWDGRSLWRYVHGIVPGATAIRAVFRFNLVLAFGVGLAIAVALAVALARRSPASQERSAASIVGLLLLGEAIVVEQVNYAKTDFLSKATLRRQIAVADAPPECKTFFVVRQGSVAGVQSAPAEDERLNALAMFIGQIQGIPTMNGHSASAPSGWAMGHVTRPDYLFRVSDWVRARGVTSGVCGLDVASGKWSVVRQGELPLVREMSAELKEGDFRFEGRMEPPMSVMQANERRNLTFWVRNPGTSTWTSITADPKHKYAVNFAYQWVDAAGVGQGFHNRSQIQGEAAPGQIARVDMTITAPATPGNYTLEIDAVQEWVAFFRHRGHPTYRVSIVVQ